MARNQNTIAKRLREMAKKRKADDKRIAKRQRKERTETHGTATSGHSTNDSLESHSEPVKDE